MLQEWFEVRLGSSPSMNLFRVAGDLTHVAAIALLCFKILATGSCEGVSLKAQELYALVHLTRYLDLFKDLFLWGQNPLGWYNTTGKLIFLLSSFSVVGLIRFHKSIRATYQRDLDILRTKWGVLACVGLALMLSNVRLLSDWNWYQQHGFDPFTAVASIVEVFWTFSIFLEAGAILPQFCLMRQQLELIDSKVMAYVILMGLYKLLYALNWLYRGLTEGHYIYMWPVLGIVWLAGLVQVGSYAGFFLQVMCCQGGRRQASSTAVHAELTQHLLEGISECDVRAKCDGAAVQEGSGGGGPSGPSQQDQPQAARGGDGNVV